MNDRMTGFTMQHDVALPAATGYRPAAKAVHWLIALLLLAQFVISFLMPDIGPRTVPGLLINLHFSIGIAIIAVMIVRFLHRMRYPVAPAMPERPAWERRTERVLHAVFYVVLLVGPFLGWASASAHRLPVVFFGLFTLPDIAAPKARWALVAGDVHIYAMWTLLGLIGLHVAAALYHHFVRHDAVLRRMLPEGG